MATAADPFNRKKLNQILGKVIKPSGPPTTTSNSALARVNEQYAPPGPSTAPRPTQLRSNDTQPIVNPFASLAVSAGPPGTDPYATYAANQQFQAAAQNPGAQNPATLAAAAAAGQGAFPTGSGYTAQTKLGQSYRDLMLPSAWDDPEALIDTFYRVNGMGKGGGDYGTQLESADNLGILYMALMGGDAFQGNANFVDWASNYLTNQRQADGVSLSPGEMWNALTNPDPNSPLNYYLNNPSLTPEDQVNNFMSSMRYGMESTLPAPILNALMAQVDQVGREFRSLRNTSGGSASFTDYLGARQGSVPDFNYG